MKQAIIYTLKLWLTTILLTPALRLLMVWALKLPLPWESITYTEYYELAPLYGSIYSLPAAIMLCIFIIIINRKPLSIAVKKLYITALVFIELILTLYKIFWLAGSPMANTIMTIPYVIIVTIAIWYYELKSPVAVEG